MTSLERYINAALLNSLWQGVAIAFALAIALAVLRRSDARVRYALCCVAMLALVVWPALTALDVPKGLYASAARSPWMMEIERWAPMVWTMGVCFWSLRLAWGYRTMRGLRDSGTFIDHNVVSRVAHKMRFVRRVRTAISPLVEVPSVVGLLRPVILIPTSALSALPVEQLEALIAHEIAHLRRWDHWVNLAQCCAQALLFYHPAAWWISARIREERELCCDDVAVRTCSDAVVYGRALTALEKLRVRVPEAVLSSTHGSLIGRIRRLAGADAGAAHAWVPVLVAMAALIAMLPPPQNRVDAQTLPAKQVKQSQPPAQPNPAKPISPKRAKATPRQERKEEFPGSLDAVAYATAERELNSNWDIYSDRSKNATGIDADFRTAMYESGFEHGAHYYLGYVASEPSDRSPEYQAMQANVRAAENLHREYLNALAEQRTLKEEQLRASLDQLRKDTAALREQRLIAEKGR